MGVSCLHLSKGCESLQSVRDHFISNKPVDRVCHTACVVSTTLETLLLFRVASLQKIYLASLSISQNPVPLQVKGNILALKVRLFCPFTIASEGQMNKVAESVQWLLSLMVVCSAVLSECHS